MATLKGQDRFFPLFLIKWKEVFLKEEASREGLTHADRLPRWASDNLLADWWWGWTHSSTVHTHKKISHMHPGSSWADSTGCRVHTSLKIARRNNDQKHIGKYSSAFRGLLPDGPSAAAAFVCIFISVAATLPSLTALWPFPHVFCLLFVYPLLSLSPNSSTSLCVRKAVSFNGKAFRKTVFSSFHLISGSKVIHERLYPACTLYELIQIN